MDRGPAPTTEQLQTPAETAGLSATPDDVALWHALYQLEAAYWRDVDLNHGRNAHELFVPDGILVVGHNRFQGREEIRAFYRWREHQAVNSVSGASTTRHLINNMNVEPIANGRARVIGIVTLYGGVTRGHAPLSHPPVFLADLSNECVQDADGRWRFSSHVLQPVFVSHETALSMAIDARSHRAWAARNPPHDR